MAVRLNQLDKDFTVDLPVGTTVLGRGPLLKCADKKISRNHAEIEVSKDGRVFLNALHVNPCFYKEGGDSPQKSVTQRIKQELHNGDIFSLLSDAFTYEINIGLTTNAYTDQNENEKIQSTTESVENSNLEKSGFHQDLSAACGSSSLNSKVVKKRILPEWLIRSAAESSKEDPISSTNKSPIKKRTEPSASGEETSTKTVKAGTSKNNKAVETDKQKRNISSDSETEANDTRNKVKKLKEDDAKTKVNNSGDGNNNKVTTNDNSPSKPPRKPCPYGSGCYRKNPIHFRESSHPGDPDYKDDSEDENDDRPECEYGLSCYRKNPLHQKDYKHTAKLPKREAARKANAANKAMNDDDEDGDYESSFIDDDDTDEYNPKSSSSESEENLDELLTEAKKIIRK